MISKIFKNLEDPKFRFQIGSIKDGTIFEKGIHNLLGNHFSVAENLSEICDKKREDLIKKNVTDYKESSFLQVQNSEKKHFISQPFGTQAYPDFLIFTENKIIPLEVKFSKKEGKPVWNSGLPRNNGFYIFASKCYSDVTFFCGKDIISDLRRKDILNFFERLKQEEINFKDQLKEKRDQKRRGFVPYIRKAYDQQLIAGSESNYFRHPSRIKVEEKAKQYVEKLEKS